MGMQSVLDVGLSILLLVLPMVGFLGWLVWLGRRRDR